MKTRRESWFEIPLLVPKFDRVKSKNSLVLNSLFFDFEEKNLYDCQNSGESS